MVENPAKGQPVRFTEAYREQLRRCGHRRGPCSCKAHVRERGDQVGILDAPFRPDAEFWDVRWPDGLRYAYRLTDLERAEGASNGEEVQS